MKRLLYLLFAAAIISCQQKLDKDHVVLSGKIKDPIPSKNITISSSDIDQEYKGLNYRETIEVLEDGTFLDTLKLPDNEYDFSYNRENLSIDIKKGYDLKINFDAKALVTSINFEGAGYAFNQFNADKKRLKASVEKEYVKNNISDIDSFIRSFSDKQYQLIQDYNDLLQDSILKKEKQKITDFFSNEKYVQLYVKQLKTIKAKKKMMGTHALNFSFEDRQGSIVSLSDFKGKYVFLDIWATWCGPCKFQLPFLEKIYQEFKEENIVFVGISIDSPQDKMKWLDILEIENHVGVQLFENQGGESNFISSLKINTIPRYLIIDPNGRIVDTDAPRPSSENELARALHDLLDTK